jgi:histidinol-phosphate aminotransferase
MADESRLRGVVQPRATGPGFRAYEWAQTGAQVAARHGLSPAHVLRFDANLPALPARLPVNPRRALARRAEYPEGSYAELRAAAAAYVGCSPDEVVVDAGADGLLYLVARTFLGAGRRAFVLRPTYPVYAIASRVECATVDEHATAGVEGLRQAARRAHVLWLCNPGNPDGRLIQPSEIAALADAMPETLVCVDEAYYEYCDETVAPLARTRDNLVAVRTLSKAFGLAGLRVGYAVTSVGVARELTARRSPAPIADVAAMLASAALHDPAPARAEATATREERARVHGALANAGHDVELTHTNFIYVRTRDAAAISACLERKGLVVRAYADALRITLRSPGDDDLLLDALGTAAEPSLRRSVTVLAPHIRVSLTLDGSGRSSVRTGDDALDEELEGQAQMSGWDLELVADDDVGAETVLAALTEAKARASP